MGTPSASLLVVTNEYDPHVDLVLSKLGGASRFRLDIEDVLTGATTVELRDGELTFRGVSRTLTHNECAAVWWRKPILPPGGGMSDAERASWEFLLDNVAALLQAARWLNPVSSYWRASKKLLQLQLAREHGLRLPWTHFTTAPAGVAIPYDAVLCKSIVTQHSVQGTHAEASPGNVLLQRAEIPADTTYPALLQEFIPRRHELRVTVVGEHVFGATLHPTGDYIDIKEVAGYPVSAFDVTDPLRSKLLAMMRGFGLDYCAFDFLVVDEGEPVFLEMNPNGQWLWLESSAGLPISDTFARVFREWLHE